MNIGLIDVDGHGHFPNIALMKLARWHREHGDSVEFYSTFGIYDRVYMSKVFSFTADYKYTINNAREVIKGGTGYSLTVVLPKEVDKMQPDYSIYPWINNKTAYGKLTLGCPNRCHWCLVPKKEGQIVVYMDIDEIAIEGRNKIILIDNNLIASEDYAMSQFEKIIERGYSIDINQGNDARLITRDIAKTMARIKWINGVLRFGCDTKAQIDPCEMVIDWLREFGFRGTVELYTMIHGEIDECYHRISRWRTMSGRGINIVCQSQPWIDFRGKHQKIPQWQKDMARWSNRKELYKTTDFMNFSPRKNFICSKYFD